MGRGAFERILVAAAALAAVAAAVLFLRAPDPEAGAPGRGGYALTATDGSTFTEASLEGHPSAVFFGFTHCPDICPTTLGEIGTWREELGAEARDLRFWFVTVDPERDSVDGLRDYLSWSPGVTGAGGTRAEVDEALAAFRVYARKVPLSDGGYTMDHSSFVMLFDRDGRFVRNIGYREETGSAVAKLRALIGAGAG
ncbi:SCO family protein [Amaricoccus solimangrovi]|uniref:SCO family protein n=1 Tax=Amaricoccus solimangrovi TaxID=2589815 RepID=A0A501WVM7_9RHOB|nr:SCO family protein [Amaricoccus solimangrovi]TPE51437.1 SCO family protein [Amaricoccus solimangrovi]